VSPSSRPVRYSVLHRFCHRHCIPSLFPSPLPYSVNILERACPTLLARPRTAHMSLPTPTPAPFPWFVFTCAGPGAGCSTRLRTGFFFHRIAATCSGFSPFQFPFGFHFSVSHGTCNTLWRLSPVLFRYQQRQLYFCSPVSLYRPHVLYHLLSDSVLTLYAFCTLSPFLSGRYGLIRL